MTNEAQDAEASDPLLAADDLKKVDFDGVLADPGAIDPHDHWAPLHQAAQAAREREDEIAANAFKLMAGLCSMSIDPENSAEPFRPRLILEGRRSMIPADLPAEQYAALAAIAASLGAPALRARVADLCWTVDRRAAEMAELAVDAYAASLKGVLADEAVSEDESFSEPQAIGVLQRALNIQRMIGWDKPAADRLRQLVRRLRQAAFAAKSPYMFSEIVELDALYELSPAAMLAAESEALAAGTTAAANYHWAHSLWLAAARFHHRNGDRAAGHRCTVEAAEQYVKVAEKGEFGLYQAFWLDRAIETLKKAKGTAARRKELQTRLLDAQAEIGEYAVPIEHKVDVRDIIRSAREQVAGLPVLDGLLALASIAASPDPDQLRAEEQRRAGRYVLSSLFDTVIHSHDWRKTATIPGAASGDEEALRGKIVQMEEYRRRLSVVATEHARFQLMLEHAPTFSLVRALAAVSPLVEPDHDLIVAKGLMSYLGGDHLTAIHLLVPQLESGLRYLLTLHGEDCVIIRPGGSQEKAKLGDLLGKLRPKLVEILGEPIVFEIENLFARPEGPKLRPNIAHGLLPQQALTSADSIYACWFLFRLVLLFFIGRVDEVRAHLGELADG
jgi:hypothetical protein